MAKPLTQGVGGMRVGVRAGMESTEAASTAATAKGTADTPKDAIASERLGRLQDLNSWCLHKLLL